MDYVKVFWSHDLGWDAMLKMTKLNLNLFQVMTCTYSLKKVQEMEISCIFNRYCKANNKYLTSYDPPQTRIKTYYILRCK